MGSDKFSSEVAFILFQICDLTGSDIIHEPELGIQENYVCFRMYDVLSEVEFCQHKYTQMMTSRFDTILE